MKSNVQLSTRSFVIIDIIMWFSGSDSTALLSIWKFLKVIGDTMDISKASVSRSLMSLSQCLVNIAAGWISFPTSNAEINVSDDYQVQFNCVMQEIVQHVDNKQTWNY